ncbi:hypothetical protein QR680_010164 [Steinernema hermaphroditum]|uniref:Uncharacterized protein n=1 Tax=Steinernema hermaphroditum TaxID=289476 RepID=A0AA39IN04_9BILA|nr:hypothetical protein QR680_010164 [Steinernema hermaphroditum]
MASIENIWLGAGIIVSSFTTLALNGVVLTTIAANSEFRMHTSYKIMLLMGVFDVAQSSMHFISGIFTVLQYHASVLVQNILAAVISPSSLSFVLVTILLSFNRFVLFCLPRWEKQIFSPFANRIWLAFVVAFYTFFASIQMSNRVYTYYDVTSYKWSYDSTYPWTDARANIVLVYQLVGIFFAFCLYIAITIKLWRVRTEMGASSSFKANRKILIQAVVIMVYCTLQIFLWHEIDNFIEPGNIQNYVMNMLWIWNSALNCFLCIVVNGKIRKRIKRMFKKTLFMKVSSMQTSRAQSTGFVQDHGKPTTSVAVVVL